MEAIPLSFDDFSLLIVAVVVASMSVLTVMVYTSDRQNASNVYFGLFCIASIVWSILNYIFFIIPDPALAFWSIKGVISSGSWFVTFLLLFLSTFPESKPAFSFRIRMLLLACAAGVSILALTPFVFKEIGSLDAKGQISTIKNGPLIPLYGAFVLSCVIGGITFFLRKFFSASKDQRPLMRLVLVGMAVTFTFLMTFNLILPAFFDNATFVRYGSLFIFPLIVCIAMALLNYKFLNAKAAAIGILTALLCIVIAVEVVFSSGVAILLVRIGEFIFVLAFGLLLVRQVVREANQREIIERQEQELEVANEQQVNLLHFISHEIKGYLTKGQNAFASIVEGDYGEASPGVSNLAQGALNEMRKGVETVMGILEASNFKKGTVSYNKKEFDFKLAVVNIADDLRVVAEHKGLQFEMHVAPTGDFKMLGDEEKLKKHVIRNLVDNAVRYTPKGNIIVSISDGDGRVHFAVKDSGVGITQEDMKRLFTEGGHGKESIKVNVDSTGYGLYIAKQVVDAHGGKIWAESEGAGKGSTFIVEFPNGA